MADEYLIEDDDAEPIDDDERDDIIYNYGGIEMIVKKAFAQGAGVTARSRSYTGIIDGALEFGYRDADSLRRTQAYKIQSARYSSYYGLSCNAAKIKIMQDISRSNLKLKIKTGSYYGKTGYLTVITEVTKSVDHGISWKILRIPFQNGICVMKDS